MMIKLVIIGAVILGGVIIFSNEIYQLLPEFSTNISDSAKKDLNQMKDNTMQTTETTIGAGVKTVSDGINDFAESTAEQLSEGIKDLGESVLQVISFGGILGDSQKANSESADSQKANSESAERHTTISNPTPSRDSSPTTIVTKTQTTQTFETLSLKTTQQLDDTVMIHYEDTSGKTISVTVILRTTEKDLFIGTFYSSMFEASVNDATKTSYFIDMIVEHEDYGTIVSSVFNPVDTPDTIINGVFSQS
ncbi:MAG: hypothetical protein IH814_02120 [Thaumarchaeota archaeon]|nr:hypothetical protein [Nitrososphaerota archaeon]